MYKNGVILLALILFCACKRGNLEHIRVVQNNTVDDTIYVINPDFDDARDTIPPGDTAHIYRYEVLDTRQEFESCAWQGDTLIIFNQDDQYLNRSVKIEGYWDYTVRGTEERVQTCTFEITDGDF